jgi:hypothetical protein
MPARVLAGFPDSVLFELLTGRFYFCRIAAVGCNDGPARDPTDCECCGGRRYLHGSLAARHLRAFVVLMGGRQNRLRTKSTGTRAAHVRCGLRALLAVEIKPLGRHIAIRHSVDVFG